MQSPDTIKPEDVIDIVIRRRWYILTPLFFALIFGIYYTFTAPRKYVASTLVMVEAQQVPKEFVRSVVTDDAESMLSIISQQITSSTNLERVINDFNLLPKDRPDISIEDVFETMKQKIVIRVKRDRQGTDTFSISYEDTSPKRAMEITNALASNFIEANQIEREDQAAGTKTFLESELETVRKRLIEKEGELKEYRQRFMGELPEQLGSNLSVLQGLQNQLTAKEASLRDLKNRLTEIENQASTSSEGETDPNDIGSLKRKLDDLLMRYTENHPDVTRLRNRIEELEKLPADGKNRLTTSSPFSREKSELLRDKSALEFQIAQLQSQIRIYQSRVEETPKREQELISLRRDYDNVDNIYKSLLKRKLESEIAISMERNQKGEKYRIVDRAQLPKTPIEPDLKRIFMLTLAIGFGLGCGLAFLLEFLDSSYRRPEKVEDDFNIPVIATIPAVYSPKAIYKKRIEMGMCGVFAFIILVLIGAFSLVTLGANDQALDIVKQYISLGMGSLSEKIAIL
jgi:polysaccharide chain length determinant protein (PEP-CTERM system associated)